MYLYLYNILQNVSCCIVRKQVSDRLGMEGKKDTGLSEKHGLHRENINPGG